MINRGLVLLFLSITAKDKVENLYHKIDPYSISKQLAFYELYPDTNYGKKALSRALDLINIHRPLSEQIDCNVKLPPFSPNRIIHLSSQLMRKDIAPVDMQELMTIQKLSSHLCNRKLKGFYAKTIEDVDALDEDQVDLTRALLLELVEDPQTRLLYESMLDLMALEILAHLPQDATLEEKLEKISEYVFFDMEYRFPPKSIWVEQIDSYTLLPTILNSRFGVCLGVSTLYLGLAQRLDLPLVPITPPGHIFVRYEEGQKSMNIETTARGIILDDDHYLSIQTKFLKRRSIKEVVGLNFMNQGALYWQQSAHEKAIEAYTIAEKYLPNDPLLLRFKGLQYLFSSNLGAAIPILEKVKGATVEGSTYQDTQIEDFLDKKIDIEGLKMLYDKDGIDRSSIKKQIEKMEAKLEQFPEFRDGIFQLAGCWLSLNRTKEAFAVLKKYHQIDPKNPVVEYYLAALALDRLELEEGKLYLKNANELLKKQNFYPECLKELSAAYKKADPSF